MTIISYLDYYAAGGTRAQLTKALESGRLVSMRRSKLLAPGPRTTPQEEHRLKVQAAGPFLGDATLVARHSAAVVHGLPVFSKRLDRVAVIRTGGGHGTIEPLIHARRGAVDPIDVALIDGVPLTGLARTAADLARELPFPEAVMIVDAALRQGAEREEITARVGSGRGCRRAERAILFGDGRAESPGESVSRAILHLAGLPTPELQHEVYDAAGKLLGRLDFYWKDRRLGGEFDGRTKYADLVPEGSSADEVMWEEKRRELGIGDIVESMTRWTWSDMWNGVMVRRVARALGVRDFSIPVLSLPPGISVQGQPSRRGPALPA